MKRTLTAAVLGAALTALTPSLAVAAVGPVAGTWTSVDADGSNQTLYVVGTGQRAYAMVYLDDAAGVCGGSPAKVTGPGWADGDVVTMVGTLTCTPGGNVFRHRLQVTFTHDAGAGTLTDSYGIVWTRAT